MNHQTAYEKVRQAISEGLVSEYPVPIHLYQQHNSGYTTCVNHVVWLLGLSEAEIKAYSRDMQRRKQP